MLFRSKILMQLIMRLQSLYNKYQDLNIDLNSKNKLHSKMKRLILIQKRNLDILF